MTYQPHQSEDSTLKTPAAAWRETGAADPHGTRYDCERAALPMGKLTDDELANGVFMHGDGTHGRAPIEEVVAGRAFWPIAWLTAAKDRIRWLSRALERERARNAGLTATSGLPNAWTLQFRAASELPMRPDKNGFPQAVLYNQCDGFHLAFARFYEDGSFDGFYDWCGTDAYEPDKHFCAWALLPDTALLFEPFARKGPYVEPGAEGTPK